MSELSDVGVAEENDGLIQFLLKRAMETDAPLRSGQLYEEYKEHNGSKLSAKDFEKRFAPSYQNIKKYDTEELAKLYFVSSTPIDGRFLSLFRQTAKIVVDEQGRIVKFDGKKMNFEGIHANEEHMENINEHGIGKANGNRRVEKYSNCKPSIISSLISVDSSDHSSSPVATDKTKSVNDWLTSIPDNTTFEKKIVGKANTSSNSCQSDMDTIRRLFVQKQKKDGDDYRKSVSKADRPHSSTEITLESENDAEESDESDSISAFVQSESDEESSAESNSGSNTEQSEQSDGSHSFIDSEQSDDQSEKSEESDSSEDSELSDNQTEKSEESDSASDSERSDSENDRGKKSKVKHKTAKRFKQSEDLEILEFLVEKAKHSDKPIILSSVWTELVRKMKTKRTPLSIQTRFRRNLAPRIHEMKEFELNTKVRMLFASSTPVHKKFLRLLKKKGSVKLDSKRRIIKYKADEKGGLWLEGDHSRSTKAKSSAKKRRHEESEDSDNYISSTRKTIKRTKKRVERRKRVVIDSSDDEENENEEEEAPAMETEDQPCTSSAKQIDDNLTLEDSLASGAHFDYQDMTEVHRPESPRSIEIISETIVGGQGSKKTLNSCSPAPKSPPTNFSHYITNAQHGIPQTSYFSPSLFHTNNVTPDPRNSSFLGPRRQFMDPGSTSDQFGTQYYSAPSQSVQMNRDAWATSRFMEQTSETISFKDFMKQLKIMIISLDTPLLSELSEQIKSIIEKIGDNDEQLSVTDVQSVLKTSLVGVTRKFRLSVNSGQLSMVRGAREFLKAFRCLLFNLESVSLLYLQNQVNQTLECIGDQIIFISDIQQSVQTILSTFSR